MLPCQLAEICFCIFYIFIYFYNEGFSLVNCSNPGEYSMAVCMVAQYIGTI